MSGKKRSVGTTIFGIVFIVVGIFLLFQSISYFTSERPLYLRQYSVFRKIITQFVDLVKEKGIDIQVVKEGGEGKEKPKLRIRSEGQGYEELKTDLAEYRKGSLMGKYVPISVKLLVVCGFIFGALFVICGASILTLFHFARILTICGAFVSLLYVPLLAWSVYFSINDILNFFNDALLFVEKNIPDFDIPGVFITGFKLMFLGPVIMCNLIIMGINIVFVIMVYRYFTHPEVKKQFE